MRNTSQMVIVAPESMLENIEALLFAVGNSAYLFEKLNNDAWCKAHAVLRPKQKTYGPERKGRGGKVRKW